MLADIKAEQARKLGIVQSLASAAVIALLVTPTAAASPQEEEAGKELWCGTALIAFSAIDGQNHQDAGERLINLATDAYRRAGYSDDQLAQAKALAVEETNAALASSEPAKYSFVECQALADAALPTVQADTSPVKVQYLLGPRGELKLQIQSVVEDVVVKDVVVNHGNCVPFVDFSVQHLHYGEATEMLFERCSPLEVLVKSNFGDWNLTF